MSRAFLQNDLSSRTFLQNDRETQRSRLSARPIRRPGIAGDVARCGGRAWSRIRELEISEVTCANNIDILEI